MNNAPGQIAFVDAFKLNNAPGQIAFVDAFKLNNAPCEIIQLQGGGERRCYTSEAYTEDYMLRSVKTNRLCRYGVKTEDGIVAVYSYYNIRGGKSVKDLFFKMTALMSTQEKYAFIRSVYDMRFTNPNDASTWISKNYKYYNPEDMGYFISNELFEYAVDALLVDVNNNFKF